MSVLIQVRVGQIMTDAQFSGDTVFLGVCVIVEKREQPRH